MSEAEQNKHVIQRFIQSVWRERDLQSFGAYWTEDCLNHAAPEGANRGLAALRAYHERFNEAFSAFSDVQLSVVQQVSEGDRVCSHISSKALHTRSFAGIPATRKSVTFTTIRIDRIENGKIAEHWSVADLADLMQQIKS